jgi:hypothetical protein
MKLDRDEIICGQPAKKVRDFLGGVRSGAFYYNDECDATVVSKIAKDHFGSKASAVLAELFKRGWMIKGNRANHGGERKRKVAIVSLTQVGKQSRIVSLNKRFPRAAGDVVVAELVERAKAINERDDLLCGIAELRLYGSMLDPSAATVGDVDVAFALYYKRPPPGKDIIAWNIERADQAGRDYLDYFKKITYGSAEVRVLLKARKSRLSLQSISEFERLEPVPKSKVIFKATPSVQS